MRPWLWLTPKMAHDLGPLGLKIWSHFFREEDFDWSRFQWRGLFFRNRLGIAGGVDKTGTSLHDWYKFGCGFVEVGTITPLAQAPNSGKILDRDIHARAVWNKMGFPGPGADVVLANLDGAPRPLFVNIGKNRDTPNEEAARDYGLCFEKFRDVADAFVVNVSSPNTSGLRQLAHQGFLQQILGELSNRQREKKIPILLKLSPDMTDAELNSTLETSASKVDGWILTNTTTARESNSQFSKEGGVSGAPLSQISKEKLSHAITFLGNSRGDKLVVSVGGVMTPEDVRERLDLGADLVQVYSSLIFDGPLFFQATAKYFDKV